MPRTEGVKRAEVDLFKAFTTGAFGASTRHKPRRSIAITPLVLLLCPLTSIACWREAESRYGISAQLLYAMARVESGLDANAINLSHRDRTHSYDIGLLQINSSHLPALARYGITERDLLDPCTNLHVGAWLLAQEFARRGATWDAVGAYNASCTRLKDDACNAARARYAWLVYGKLPKAQANGRTVPSGSIRTTAITAARVSP